MSSKIKLIIFAGSDSDTTKNYYFIRIVIGDNYYILDKDIAKFLDMTLDDYKKMLILEFNGFKYNEHRTCIKELNDIQLLSNRLIEIHNNNILINKLLQEN